MSDSKTPEAELIQSILETAETEARGITSEAETSISDRRAAMEKRLAAIKADAEARIHEESTRLTARADAAISVEQSRAALRAEGRAYQVVEARVREGLEALRGTPEYPGIIRGWIVEAAAGLAAERATVMASVADRDVVQSVLPEATARLGESYGLKVELSLDDSPIPGQGVVLRNGDGTMAFSNTVEDRIRRMGTEIRRVVYYNVIEEKNERSDHR